LNTPTPTNWQDILQINGCLIFGGVGTKNSKNVTKQISFNGSSDDVIVANTFADLFQ